MGNDDDRAALLAHGAQDIKQTLGLLRCQDGGGLVQNQDALAAIEHLEDFNGLLLRDRHFKGAAVGIDVQTDRAADLADFFAHNACGQAFARGTDRDILRSSEHIDQLKVLVDHADAKRHCVLG